MRAFALAFLVLAVLSSPAQLRNAHWIMGGGGWVTIQDGVMQELPFAGTNSLQTACISDTDGQLVLLVDDQGIRNASFDPVSGGSAAQLGWSVPMANYLVLPDPVDVDRYWVFTVQGSVPAQAGVVQVDLSANGGSGGIIGAGTSWFMMDCTAKLSATLDEAGSGYWVALHEAEGDAFHSYHLTAEGLAEVPVVSHAGSSYLSDSAPYGNVDRTRGLEFSAQGDRAAAIVHGITLDTNGIDLLRFDRQTGQFASHTKLSHLHYAYLPGFYELNPIIEPLYAGVEFSASGEYLYASQFDSVVHDYDQEIVEFPVHFEDPQLIADSARGVITPDAIGYNGPPGDLLAVGVDGDLHALWRSSGPRKINSFRILPVQIPPPSGWNEIFTLSATPSGFPNQSRNYHDSHPIGMGVGPAAAEARMRIFPVPMTDRITVHWEGTERPDQVLWWDSMGRLVRTESLQGRSSPWILERGGLSQGMHVLELRNDTRPLARRKVICE
ncbi:MAG TPA: hypothetical protein VGE21_05690 [Flavobacteriales bacterium]